MSKFLLNQVAEILIYVKILADYKFSGGNMLSAVASEGERFEKVFSACELAVHGRMPLVPGLNVPFTDVGYSSPAFNALQFAADLNMAAAVHEMGYSGRAQALALAAADRFNNFSLDAPEPDSYEGTYFTVADQIHQAKALDVNNGGTWTFGPQYLLGDPHVVQHFESVPQIHDR